MDHFHYKNGIYHAEDVALDALAQDIGTPFYCYSTATLTRHYQVFSSHFPDAKICYAVKANGNLAVVKTLANLGSGADVVSEGEIRLALAAGIKPQDIVFSGVGKTASEMAYALNQNIFQFNVESIPELHLLSEMALAAGVKAQIAVRVNPDVDPKTHAKIATGHKESKFGIGMGQAMEVYRLAAGLKGIEIQGVSVHIGSQLTHLEPFAQAFARMRSFVGELRAAGFPINTLDLGGGLGIPYGNEEPPLPEAYAEIVRRETDGLNCRLIFEPGRVLVGNAGILVTRVIYVKQSEGRFFVIVDAGMNDLIRPALYEAYHDIVPIIATGEGSTELVDVVGPVCETGDIFAEQRLLKLPKAGDLLAFRTAGAYGAAMASTYNARPLIAEIMVNGAQYAVIRPRQSYDELLRRDRLPEWL
ncbi:MAG: diaminopimelate decarboxylase [Pseudomonadota bacterium]|nr:diaminopimelate decarboxylase [Pseudomonadota bacterium]